MKKDNGCTKEAVLSCMSWRLNLAGSEDHAGLQVFMYEKYIIV